MIRDIWLRDIVFLPVKYVVCAQGQQLQQYQQPEQTQYYTQQAPPPYWQPTGYGYGEVSGLTSLLSLDWIGLILRQRERHAELLLTERFKARRHISTQP